MRPESAVSVSRRRAMSSFWLPPRSRTAWVRSLYSLSPQFPLSMSSTSPCFTKASRLSSMTSVNWETEMPALFRLSSCFFDASWAARLVSVFAVNAPVSLSKVGMRASMSFFTAACSSAYLLYAIPPTTAAAPTANTAGPRRAIPPVAATAPVEAALVEMFMEAMAP